MKECRPRSIGKSHEVFKSAPRILRSGAKKFLSSMVPDPQGLRLRARGLENRWRVLLNRQILANRGPGAAPHEGRRHEQNGIVIAI